MSVEGRFIYCYWDSSYVIYLGFELSLLGGLHE